jgi:hypothetical protein
LSSRPQGADRIKRICTRPVLANCGGSSLAGISGDEVRVYRLSCKLWTCARCNVAKVRATLVRLYAGLELGSTWFVTLTLPGDAEAATSFDRISAAWRRLAPRLRRRYGRFEFFAVVELQDRGVAHLHVLIRGIRPRLPWLRANAIETGFGTQVDVRPAGFQHSPYMVESFGPVASASMPRYVHGIKVAENGHSARKLMPPVSLVSGTS